MTNHDETVKDSESSSWYSKEINSGNIFDMVFKECLPCLRGWFLLLDHIVRNSSFTNIISELKQFWMYSWCSPGWIFQTHLSDKITNFLLNLWSSDFMPAFPTPIQFEAFAMQFYDSFRLNDNQREFPLWPDLRQPGPKGTVWIFKFCLFFYASARIIGDAKQDFQGLSQFCPWIWALLFRRWISLLISTLIFPENSCTFQSKWNYRILHKSL